tara:strand:+ start:2258 stop:2482 length:225 start_codon:yes stop_codon:yes gene_type:complete
MKILDIIFATIIWICGIVAALSFIGLGVVYMILAFALCFLAVVFEMVCLLVVLGAILAIPCGIIYGLLMLIGIV